MFDSLNQKLICEEKEKKSEFTCLYPDLVDCPSPIIPKTLIVKIILIALTAH